jgi:magnesium transporter
MAGGLALLGRHEALGRLSMTIAGVAGAGVPLVLRATGQDPAQSSSIILTTVTDISGFFSFLGLAALFASWL